MKFEAKLTKTKTSWKLNIDENPPRGDGEWALRSLLKTLLQSCNMKEMHFVPCTLDPKAYNLLKKLIFMQGGAPLVFFLLNFVKICQSFLLFYRKPAKNNQQILIEYSQKHFKGELGKPTKVCRKIPSKKMKWTK